MGRHISAFVLSCLLLTKVYAQDASEKKIGLPSVGLGVGILTYYGDVGSEKRLSPFTGNSFGYNLNIHQRLGFAGVSLNALKGTLLSNEGSEKRRLNFSTSVLDLSLNFSFHFDNGFILPEKAMIAPYISAGIGYLSFKPYSDLKDKDGRTYFYWSDGSIRDKSENDPDKALSSAINRDYKYETSLPAAGDSLNNDFIKYKYSSITIPVSAGMFLKLSPSVNINIGASYYLSQTDWIDNVSSESKGARKGNSANDNYLYSYIGLTYNIGRGAKKTNSSSNNIDFTSLEKGDIDKDGVSDVNDKCADTPAGVKTDSDGCPLDSDNDGIYDYIDKEPKTKRGSIVDANGIALHDDSLVVEHVASARVTRTADPQPAVTSGISSSDNSSSGMPEMYRDLDTNKDGKISSDEINGAIDNFFEGNSKLTIDGIYKLIDYFFEQ